MAPPAERTSAAGAGPLALGAWEQSLPQCPATAGEPELAFCRAATHALRATLQEDRDDPAQLLALLNELETRHELSALALEWHSSLANAYARAQLLARLSGPLRQLRRALADAYLEPRTALYRGIDAKGCRDAFTAIAGLLAAWPDLVVTIEPLGTWPLSTLRRFCLLDRQLPAQ